MGKVGLRDEWVSTHAHERSAYSKGESSIFSRRAACTCSPHHGRESTKGGPANGGLPFNVKKEKGNADRRELKEMFKFFLFTTWGFLVGIGIVIIII